MTPTVVPTALALRGGGTVPPPSTNCAATQEVTTVILVRWVGDRLHGRPGCGDGGGGTWRWLARWKW